ncbi:uncharacterized protein LOC125014895 [Mugil cephalus]|uniref:uncharacterized protein LOC125014895 n=1 Tax=Mugil cephalus TaxID=48193 RepID=UPI001FB82B93|nr:uncharacterized protein LOC125014895 [Mugil cephalus]
MNEAKESTCPSSAPKRRHSLLNLPPSFDAGELIWTPQTIKQPASLLIQQLLNHETVMFCVGRAQREGPKVKTKDEEVGNLGEKMICRILLLITLNSCVCAATFEVNVTQSSYQAEENHHITLEWTFTTKPDSSYKYLFIFCSFFINHQEKELTLYHVHEGVEVSESQDEQFSGRVQGDKDVLREGRIRLHVSRLRINDSGLYQCEVKTDYGSTSGRCELNVTAADDQPQIQRPTSSPEPETGGQRRRRDGLIVVVALMFLCVIILIVFKIRESTTESDS